MSIIVDFDKNHVQLQSRIDLGNSEANDCLFSVLEILNNPREYKNKKDINLTREALEIAEAAVLDGKASSDMTRGHNKISDYIGMFLIFSKNTDGTVNVYHINKENDELDSREEYVEPPDIMMLVDVISQTQKMFNTSDSVSLQWVAAELEDTLYDFNCHFAVILQDDISLFDVGSIITGEELNKEEAHNQRNAVTPK